MKIAVFSDIHGNVPALRTLLQHIRQEQADGIYCLGDMFTPYPGSREIWDLLKVFHVKCVLGNNEAALLAHHDKTQNYISDEIRFRPFLFNAQEVSSFLPELQQIPANRTLAITDDLNIHLCHYSPDEVFRGLHSTFHFNIDEYVQSLSEPIILTGHLHRFEAKDIHGKIVYCVGSAGLPLKGAHQLEYIIGEAVDGEFCITYRLLPYDVQEAVDYLLQYEFMSKYGPIAWLAFDEILTQRDRLVTFFREFLPMQNKPSIDWYLSAEQFLRSINRWDEIKKYLNGGFNAPNTGSSGQRLRR
jgi:predicted phosphodiesterase